MLDSLFFYLFAGIALVGAGLTITRRNPTHAAFSLIITLLAIGGIFLQLRAGVLFVMQLTLYAGGWMILSFFVCGLPCRESNSQKGRFGFKEVVALLIASVPGLGFLVVLCLARKLPGEGLLFSGSVPADKLPPNGGALARSLFGDYFLPFEMTSLLFVVAMVGAAVMVKNRRRSEGS